MGEEDVLLEGCEEGGRCGSLEDVGMMRLEYIGRVVGL